MNAFIYALIGNLIISFSIIITIYFIKLFKNKVSENIDYITSITIGVILGIIFLGFIPEIIDAGKVNSLDFGLFILLGLLFFYFLELFLHWHHCRDLSHDDHCNHGHSLQKEHTKQKLMFLGTFLHNGIHGIVLFSAFSISYNMGIITTIAILLHSIPQNVSNYIMTYSKDKYYLIASFGGVFGTILTLPFINILIKFQDYILLLISGGLLYISLTDILPEIKDNENISSKIKYFLLIITGIIIYISFGMLTHFLGFSE